MARAWYVLHTYTGYEGKIERTVRTLLDTKELDENIVLDIKVPTEEVEYVTKTGKHTKHNEKFLPGYILMELDLPEKGWMPTCATIRRIQGVTGFVGTNPKDKPRPVSNDEAKNLLQRSGDIKGEKSTNVHCAYFEGDRVKITDGPFSGFTGLVENVKAEQERLRVNVEIFNRATPVELTYTQVEKV